MWYTMVRVKSRASSRFSGREDDVVEEAAACVANPVEVVHIVDYEVCSRRVIGSAEIISNG